MPLLLCMTFATRETADVVDLLVTSMVLNAIVVSALVLPFTAPVLP